MKVVFVGPTLAGPRLRRGRGGVDVRGPAAQGDVAEAVLQGAAVIGLVDGFFEQSAAVWHKEILYALAEGVQVFGAASMGALRAAECAAFGMVGVGEVFDGYASGKIVDDDAVAQLHGPEELDYMPLSEPLVNIEATIEVLRGKRLVTERESADIQSVAKALFFKERAYERVLAGAKSLGHERRIEIAGLIARFRRDVKREDAEALMERVSAAADSRVAPPTGWEFAETPIWRRLLDDLRKAAA